MFSFYFPFRSITHISVYSWFRLVLIHCWSVLFTVHSFPILLAIATAIAIAIRSSCNNTQRHDWPHGHRMTSSECWLQGRACATNLFFEKVVSWQDIGHEPSSLCSADCFHMATAWHHQNMMALDWSECWWVTPLWHSNFANTVVWEIFGVGIFSYT